MTAKNKYYDYIISKLVSDSDYIINTSLSGIYSEVKFPMDEHFTTYDISDLLSSDTDPSCVETDFMYLQSKYGINTKEESENIIKEYWDRLSKNIQWEMKQMYSDDSEVKCLL